MSRLPTALSALSTPCCPVNQIAQIKNNTHQIDPFLLAHKLGRFASASFLATEHESITTAQLYVTGKIVAAKTFTVVDPREDIEYVVESLAPITAAEDKATAGLQIAGRDTESWWRSAGACQADT